jgi:hypothetical protein
MIIHVYPFKRVFSHEWISHLYIKGVGIKDFDPVLSKPRITCLLKDPQDFLKVLAQLTFIGLPELLH